MAYTDMGPEIRLPSTRARPWGRFLDVVPEIKVVDENGIDRTPMGAKWMAPGAMSPIVADYSCSSTQTKTGNAALSEVVQSAFLSFNLLECSSLTGGQERLSEYVEGLFRATVSEALAIAATTPISADHINLWADSDTLSSGSSLVETIGIIESGLAARISNEQGYIFIAPRYISAAMSAGVVFLMDDILYSPAGHLVISDAGHGYDNYVFGTGALGYATTDPVALGGNGSELDRTRNVMTWLSENYGMIAMNPAHSVKSAILGAVSS